MVFPVIILAGGLATRMRPITEKTPKSMLEVSGRPFIYHQLKLLEKKGISEVVLCLGYLGKQVEGYIQGINEFHMNIRYSYDGEIQLGTGGALKKATQNMETPFFVLYGDSYLDIDYEAVQSAYIMGGQPALMTVYKNTDLYDKSNVLYIDRKVIKYDKRKPTSEMMYIDYGLGIMQKEILSDACYGSSFDLADVYAKLCQTGNLTGYEIYKRFYEIGSFEGLADLERYMKGDAGN